ncbi:MAG: trimethylamine methyltransferase family protein [Candidatus Bathyarchaeota archaeon]|nr:MAG: trimethylamine methyltransferase family protein [Candidatus Bathyarchaeota archaeon]
MVKMSGFEKPSLMPSFQVFSEDRLDAIHSASLDVLEKTGVKILHGEAVLKMLKENGCDVDFEKSVVFFPSYLVEEAVRKTKKTITDYGRNPKYDYKLDGRHIYFTTDTETVNTVDLKTGEWRPSTKEDFEKLTRVTDALESYAAGGHLTTCLDKPANTRCLHDYAAALNSTEKPCGWSVYPPELASQLTDYALEIATAVAGSEKRLRQRPLGGGGFCTESPLKFEGRYVETTLRLAELGFPCSVASMPLGGATAPVTLAGSLVVTNAEVLSGLSTIQLACPGTSVGVHYLMGSLDMKTGLWGEGPEEALLCAAAVEIGRYYGLCVTVNGFLTSAKMSGAQASYEKTMSTLLPVLAGADVVYGSGSLNGGITASFEELVIDDEICRALLKAVRGIDLNDETLALDVIHKVGPSGHYLAEKHTLQHFKEEHFFPELADRSSYDSWKKSGGKSLVEKAREKAERILEEHWPTPLDTDVQKEISEIIRRAEDELPKSAA